MDVKPTYEMSEASNFFSSSFQRLDMAAAELTLKQQRSKILDVFFFSFPAGGHGGGGPDADAREERSSGLRFALFDAFPLGSHEEAAGCGAARRRRDSRSLRYSGKIIEDAWSVLS